jgi:hypothetical protein
MTTIDGHPDCDTPLHRRRSGTLGKASARRAELVRGREGRDCS